MKLKEKNYITPYQSSAKKPENKYMHQRQN